MESRGWIESAALEEASGNDQAVRQDGRQAGGVELGRS